jgi:hypothetical protein
MSVAAAAGRMSAMSSELPDCGSPIAYLVLAEGTAVYASDRTTIGKVKHVLFVPEEDIFEGIVIDTDEGERFVDSADVGEIYERCVVTTLTPEQARALPPPVPGPPVYKDDPAVGYGSSLRDRYLRLFRKGGWFKESSGEKEMKDEEKKGR